MMEKLHATTVCLLRYGGLHPFIKTSHPDQTNHSNQTSFSVRLLLWTVLLNLMVAMIILYISMMQSEMFSSLPTFLLFLFANTYSLISILLPMHFIFHAKKITALNAKLDNIITMCSIQSSKINITNKLKIIFLIFVKIFILSNSTINFLLHGCTEIEMTNIKLFVTIIAEYHASFIEMISTLMFAIYLTILAEYLQFCEDRLVELFDGIRPSTSQISKVTAEEPDETSTRIHPLGVHSSSNAEESARVPDETSTRLHPFGVHSPSNAEESARVSIETTNTLPFLAQYSEPSQLFTHLKLSQLKKSLRTRVNPDGPQTLVPDENTAGFFQTLEGIHASIFEAYDVYELSACVLGFPILYFTIIMGIGFCAIPYKITKLYLKNTYCTAHYVSIAIANLMNFALLTTFPQTIDQKVCNVTGKSLVEINLKVAKNKYRSSVQKFPSNTEQEYFLNIHSSHIITNSS